MRNEKQVLDLLLQSGDKGEVIVFLHYFGGSAESWCDVTSRLDKNYQCLSFNLLGFGGTPAIHKLSIQHYARTVEAQLRHLKVQSYTLVGHSMGGKIALKIAANRAAGLKQVILLAPSPPTVEPMPEADKKRILQHPHQRSTAKQTIQSAIVANISLEQRELAIQTHMNMSMAVRQWWLREGMNTSIATKLRRIDVPVAAILSKDDPVIPYDQIRTELKHYLPQSQCIVTEGVGHLMPFEAPDFVANSIKTVLDTSGQDNLLVA